jgi:site-specific recombinase
MPDPEFTEDQIDALIQSVNSQFPGEDEQGELKAALQTAKEHQKKKKDIAEAKALLSDCHEQFAQAYSSNDDSGITIEVTTKVKPGRIKP